MNEDNTLIKSFYNFIADTEGLSEEDIASVLKEHNIDVSSLKMRVAEVVKKGSEKRRLAWRFTAQAERSKIKKLLDRKKISMPTSIRTKIEDILDGIFGQQASEYAEAYFRKKEALTEKDMESLIEDLEDLDLLDESAKKE